MATILLIDDEPSLRRALGRFLRTLGHEVVEAGGGGEALRVAGARTLDLVITDLNMPEVDGIEVILALRAAAPKLPIIAMSGGGLMHKSVLLETAGLLGAVVTLAKPFRLEALAEAVGRTLGA